MVRIEILKRLCKDIDSRNNIIAYQVRIDSNIPIIIHRDLFCIYPDTKGAMYTYADTEQIDLMESANCSILATVTSEELDKAIKYIIEMYGEDSFECVNFKSENRVVTGNNFIPLDSVTVKTKDIRGKLKNKLKEEYTSCTDSMVLGRYDNYLYV